MEITTATIKYGVAVATIGCAAAGLNLGVMRLTDAQPEETTSAIQTTEVPTTLDGPLQVVVDIPVVVPDSALATEQLAPADAPAATTATAAPAPAPTAAAAPPATAAPAPATTSAAPAPTAAPVTTTSPTTASQPTTTAAPATTDAAPATEYLYYDFSGVASEIIVAQHGDGSLEFWSVTAESGWNYRVEKDSPDHVEVKFSRAPEGEGEAKFELEVNEGGLRVKKER